MATLILTAVGTAVGGPIGGAIGAMIGSQADAMLFAPKPRRGPRLGDLSVQTSSYGAAIPRLFGRMRVSGTVIWATDLQERQASSGGGKSGPRTVTSSYSASFAVALSGRPIRSVGRIWADGKLLRGAGGDWKAETGFRLYKGDEDQEIDPLIAAIEGMDGAPAFRGMAYALFEDLQLADYGNRIPSLSFEVEADSAPVTIGAIAAELTGDAIVAGETPALTGFAVSGESVRGAIEGLADLAMLSLADDGMRLWLSAASGDAETIAAARLDARGRSDEGGRTEIVQRSIATIPGEIGVAYHDPARDWQNGMQRASLRIAGRPSEEIALPAAMEASAAKGLAEARLAAIGLARTTARISLGWSACSLRPGDLLRLEDESGLWRIERWSLQAMTLTLELVRVQAGTVAPAVATPGRATGEEDRPHGPTIMNVFELPQMEGGAVPQLLIAAAGREAGWRRAALSVSFDGGLSWRDAGGTAAPAAMGTAVSILGPAGAALIDAVEAVEIETLSETVWLAACDDAALASGANLALLGDELIQFGAVEPLGARRFRLSRLLRGRRGTEWAAGAHATGERFVLIDRTALAGIDLPEGSTGGEARVIAQSIGDGPEGALASRIITGEASIPPSPAHLRADMLANGDFAIGWTRRSRDGWSWRNGAETPLGEESERYRIELSGAAFTRIAETDAPDFLYTAAAQATDGPGTLTIAVSQIGDAASSRPTTLTMERP